MILTYLEIQFSKCKDIQELKKKLAKTATAQQHPKPEQSTKHAEISKSQIRRLLFNLQELEFFAERLLASFDLDRLLDNNKNEYTAKLVKAAKFFPDRIKTNVYFFI